MSEIIRPDWQQRRADHLSQRQSDHRSPFQRDRARILHSAAFRRLQAKTQVMGVGLSDFYRTRLTHSLEAAQIGSGITAQLKAKHAKQCSWLLPQDESLIEALCLAHDIGHPPYGHGGEVALHYMMRNVGGFEGNGQTFRIVTKLEPYTEQFGMNLSRRTLLGLLKYPQLMSTLQVNETANEISNFRQLKASNWHPPKGLYDCDQSIFDWVLAPLSEQDKTLFTSTEPSSKKHRRTRFKSLDCSIMELADDIAYGVHDLEDAIVTGVVNQDDFNRQVVAPIINLACPHLSPTIEQLSDRLFSDQHHLQKDAIGGLVNYLITAINLDESPQFSEPLLRFNAKLPPIAEQVLELFKQFVLHYVIKLPQIQRLEYKGQQVVMALYEAFQSDPERLLPKSTVKKWQLAEQNSAQHRVICDYIAGMTDEYAQRIHQQLFVTN